MAKYCTQCGRKLEDGEVCNCTSQDAGRVPNENANHMQPKGAAERQPGSQQEPQNDPMYQQYQQYYQQAQADTQQGPQFQQGQQSGQQGPQFQQYQQSGQQGPQFQQGQQSGQQGPQFQQYQQSGQQGPQFQQYQQSGQQGPQFQQGQQSGQQGPQYQQYQQNGPQYQQEQPGGYTKEAEWINRQKKAFVSGTKNMFSEILPILKSPVNRVRQISSSNDARVGIQLIISKAVIFLVVMIIALLMLSNKIQEASMGLIETQMPYIQVILVTLILTAGIDFLESVVLKAITGAFNGITDVNTMLNVIGARAIYDTFLLVIVAILGLVSWKVAFVAFALLSPLITYIQFASYQGCVRLKEDKKPYSYFIAKLCIGIISFLIIYLITRTFMDSIPTSILNGLF